jgi:hypothetical protein
MLLRLPWSKRGASRLLSKFPPSTPSRLRRSTNCSTAAQTSDAVVSSRDG